MQLRTQYVRPSGAGIWSKCLGYAKLCAELHAALPEYYEEETDIDVREDGTACHWLAHEEWWKRHQPTGIIAPNNRVITDEMHEAVSEYHEILLSWPNVVPVLEEQMPVSRAVWGCSDGTPDAWAFDPNTYTLYVADLKYGFKFVEVWRNLQMTLYAFGIAYKLDLDLSRLKIIFHIFQPRSFHPDGPLRIWKTTANDLMGTIEMPRIAAAGAHGENPPCTVNEGCPNCPARHACKAYQASALQLTLLSGDSTPHTLNSFQLSRELAVLEDAARLLEGRIEGLREQAAYINRTQGGVFPFHEMSSGTGRERYKEGAEESVLRLAKMFNVVEPTKPLRAKSPAQLRKGGFPSYILAEYTERPSTGLKLRRVSQHAAEKKYHKFEGKNYE